MTQMNPVTGSILQTSMVQKQQTGDKARQLHHAHELRKNVAAREDESEPQVENPEELSAIDADHSNPRNPKKEGRKSKSKPEKSEDEEKPHIDMTA